MKIAHKCDVCEDKAIMHWNGEAYSCERAECLRMVIDMRTLLGKPDWAKSAWAMREDHLRGRY